MGRHYGVGHGMLAGGEGETAHGSGGQGWQSRYANCWVRTLPCSEEASLFQRLWPTNASDTNRAPATSPDSLHSAILPIAPESKLTAASQAEKFVQDRVASGQSSYIKVICDVPGPDQATVDAIVAAAHQSKLRVVAHAASSVAYQMAQQAKVDYVTHAPLDTVLTTEECDTMAREHRIAIPTLTMMTATTAGPSLWTILRMLLFAPRMMLAIVRAKRSGATKGPPKYENARESVRNLHKAGGTILAGTDAHESEPAAFHVPHGESLHRELELLVEAGLSNVEALCAATKLPAKHFDLGDRGVIEVGKRADLVLLEFGPDPLGGRIRDTRQIAKVWVGGVNVEGL